MPRHYKKLLCIYFMKSNCFGFFVIFFSTHVGFIGFVRFIAVQIWSVIGHNAARIWY